MPMLKKTVNERREIAFREALARGKAGKGLDDYQISGALQMSRATLSVYRKDGPWKMELARFGELARKVGMTGREVCKIVGVPYQDREEVDEA